MDRRTFLALAGSASLGVGSIVGELSTKPVHVNLILDDAAFIDALDEVLKYQSLEGFDEVFEPFFNDPGNLLCIECGPASKGTCLVTLKPSQRLLDFLTAARAGNLELFALQGTHN